MQFKGRTRNERGMSQSLWCCWRQDTSDQPQKQAFAVAWVARMEALAQRQHAQVRNMAEQTLRETRREVPDATEADIREVISILSRVWYLGTSLRNWVVERSRIM